MTKQGTVFLANQSNKDGSFVVVHVASETTESNMVNVISLRAGKYVLSMDNSGMIDIRDHYTLWEPGALPSKPATDDGWPPTEVYEQLGQALMGGEGAGQAWRGEGQGGGDDEC